MVALSSQLSLAWAISFPTGPHLEDERKAMELELLDTGVALMTVFCIAGSVSHSHPFASRATLDIRGLVRVRGDVAGLPEDSFVARALRQRRCEPSYS